MPASGNFFLQHKCRALPDINIGASTAPKVETEGKTPSGYRRNPVRRNISADNFLAMAIPQRINTILPDPLQL